MNKILGNEILIRNLKNAIKNKRVNHAYIFDGMEGSGKRLIASQFAKTLNCFEGGTEPCRKCSSCIGFDSGNSPDIIYIKDEKEIKVDTVREKINKEVYIKPFYSRYKIFIIENGDTMNPQAQNAFLKTLEEPPQYGIFLITSRNYKKFLTTILSRCVMFRTKPLPPSVIKKYLIDQGISDEEAETAAHFGQGSLGKSMALAQNEDFRLMSSKAFEISLQLENTDLIGMYKIADSLKEYSDNIDTFLELMSVIYRDALVLTTAGSGALMQTDRTEQIKNIAAIGTARLIKCCDSISYARERLKAKGDLQFTLEELLFNIKTNY